MPKILHIFINFYDSVGTAFKFFTNEDTNAQRLSLAHSWIIFVTHEREVYLGNLVFHSGITVGRVCMSVWSAYTVLCCWRDVLFLQQQDVLGESFEVELSSESWAVPTTQSPWSQVLYSHLKVMAFRGFCWILKKWYKGVTSYVGAIPTLRRLRWRISLRLAKAMHGLSFKKSMAIREVCIVQTQA